MRLRIHILTTAIVLCSLLSIAHAADPAPAPVPSASTPWWAIVSVIALALSEVLALVPGWKSNSVVQLILNGIRTVFGKDK